MENTTTLAEFHELLSSYQSPELKKLTKMIYYRYRLKTFASWPFSASKEDKCTPENMAAAGFFSISRRKNDTSVKCFCCLKELDGWEAMDDPWEEHKCHQPKCFFVTLDTKEQEWTLEHYIDMYHSLTVNFLDSNSRSDLENLEYDLNKKQNKLQKEKRKRRR